MKVISNTNTNKLNVYIREANKAMGRVTKKENVITEEMKRDIENCDKCINRDKCTGQCATSDEEVVNLVDEPVKASLDKKEVEVNLTELDEEIPENTNQAILEDDDLDCELEQDVAADDYEDYDDYEDEQDNFEEEVQYDYDDFSDDIDESEEDMSDDEIEQGLFGVILDQLEEEYKNKKLDRAELKSDLYNILVELVSNKMGLPQHHIKYFNSKEMDDINTLILGAKLGCVNRLKNKKQSEFIKTLLQFDVVDTKVKDLELFNICIEVGEAFYDSYSGVYLNTNSSPVRLSVDAGSSVTVIHNDNGTDIKVRDITSRLDGLDEYTPDVELVIIEN